MAKLFERLNSKVFILLAAVLLLSPASSSSVLCIAPGDHVAIEDLDAGCCASSDIFTNEDRHPGDGINTATHCRNCTDLFITPSERGPVPTSFISIAPAGSLADDFSGDRLLVITFSPLILQRAFNDVDTSKPALSSILLRC